MFIPKKGWKLYPYTWFFNIYHTCKASRNIWYQSLLDYGMLYPSCMCIHQWHVTSLHVTADEAAWGTYATWHSGCLGHWCTDQAACGTAPMQHSPYYNLIRYCLCKSRIWYAWTNLCANPPSQWLTVSLQVTNQMPIGCISNQIWMSQWVFWTCERAFP